MRHVSLDNLIPDAIQPHSPSTSQPSQFSTRLPLTSVKSLSTTLTYSNSSMSFDDIPEIRVRPDHNSSIRVRRAYAELSPLEPLCTSGGREQVTHYSRHNSTVTSHESVMSDTMVGNLKGVVDVDEVVKYLSRDGWDG
ncbi:hypothetical protein Tco_0232207 [Tanacetum coccineum]